MILSILKYLINTRRPLIDGYPRINYRRRYAVGFDHPDGSPTEYPQIIMPKRGTLITLPTKGRGKNTKKGPGEGYLCWYVLRHHLKGFYDNVALNVGGHRYVPDLAYIDTERGIFIDIENDEPYTIGKRIPTHTIGGKDDERNRAIRDAGWIVVRFSERQAFEHTAGCIRYVYDLLRTIDPSIGMPHCLKDVMPLHSEPRWSNDQARQLADDDYRMSYMSKHLDWWIYYHILSGKMKGK